MAKQETQTQPADAQPEDASGQLSLLEPVVNPTPGDGGDQAAADGEQQGGPDDDDDTQADPSLAPTPEAPYGFFKSGRARISPPGYASASSKEKAKQRARLKSVTASKPKSKTIPTPQVPALAIVNYQAMGETAANMFFGVGTMAFGADWEPDVAEGEPQAVAGAFRNYFKATQMQDLPPGWALAAVLLVYTVKRAQKPTVKGRLLSIGMWFKDAALKLKRAGR